MLTEVNDVGTSIGEVKGKELLDLTANLSKKSDVVVISGGMPKGLSADYYEKLFSCVDKKCKKIADTTGERLLASLRAEVDLVKPNLDELEGVLGRELKDREDILSGCFELLDRGAKRVLLSLGKKGAIITDGKDHFYCKSMNVAVNSTVGAGDGMVAAAAVALEKDADLKEILRCGVSAGTATVTTVGDISFTKEKYEEIYRGLTVENF
jgi:1-phosphofructokinase family hexose kinase